MISAEQRDHDIHTFAVAKDVLSQTENICFLVTGSYAIEALTQTSIDNNDMDANIFAPNVPHAKASVLDRLGNIQFPELGLKLYKQSPDRLEYDSLTLTVPAVSRRLEIHLIEAVPDSQSREIAYIVKAQGFKTSRIQLVEVGLQDSAGRNFLFLVKSLPYTIATWALRISGAVQNQSRPVRDSDLHLFGVLLAQDFSPTEVYSAIEHHPQAPERAGPENIFQTAQNILLKGNG